MSQPLEAIVHSRTEMIAALQLLATDEPPAMPSTICLWRSSGLTWFKFGASFGRDGLVKRGRRWETVKDFTPLESLWWRREKVKRIIAAVRRIPEREFLR